MSAAEGCPVLVLFLFFFNLDFFSESCLFLRFFFGTRIRCGRGATAPSTPPVVLAIPPLFGPRLGWRS